jgi:hypothetical protein
VEHSNFSVESYKLECVLVEQSSVYNVHLVEFDASILKEMKVEMIKFNCLLGYISEILLFVELAYPAAELCLRDILRQYNSKMNLIDDEHQENVNPCA